MKKSGFNDDGKSVLFMAVSPTKKKRDPKTDKLTNGETKKVSALARAPFNQHCIYHLFVGLCCCHFHVAPPQH